MSHASDAKGKILFEKAEEKAPLYRNSLLVCYSFPSASSAIISDVFDGKPSYRT